MSDDIREKLGSIPKKYGELIAELLGGASLTKQLVERHGYTYSSVYNLLRRRGLLEHFKVNTRSTPNVPAEWLPLVRDMKDNGLSINEASEKYGRKYDQIYHFLKYRGLLEVCGVKTRNANPGN